MSLVPDYESSSETESSATEEDDTKLCEEKKQQTPEMLLPSASTLLSGSKTSTGVVFNNPYKNAENEKIANLEKHVKMVATEEHTYIKNGKKMCWNFRKGRCRFGSNCTFAHDSDLHKSDASMANDNLKQTLNEVSATITKTKRGPKLESSTSAAIKDCEENGQKKKKRPGLSNSIIPSKKVMHFYNKNK